MQFFGRAPDRRLETGHNRRFWGKKCNLSKKWTPERLRHKETVSESLARRPKKIHDQNLQLKIDFTNGVGAA